MLIITGFVKSGSRVMFPTDETEKSHASHCRVFSEPNDGGSTGVLVRNESGVEVL